MMYSSSESSPTITFVYGCIGCVNRGGSGKSLSTIVRRETRIGWFVRWRRTGRVPYNVSGRVSRVLICSGERAPSDENEPMPSYVIHSDSDNDDDDMFVTRYVPQPPATSSFSRTSRPPSKSPTRETLTENEDKEAVLLGPDLPFLEDCDVCKSTGFVPCSKCGAEGFIRNPRSKNAFYCPVCVGHKKVRCPSCGGKCYMC